MVNSEEDANVLSETGCQIQSDQGEILIDDDGTSVQMDELTSPLPQPRASSSEDVAEAVDGGGDGDGDGDEVEKNREENNVNDVEQQNSTNV